MVTRTPNISLAKPEFDRRQWQGLMNDNMTVIDALWAKYFATTGLVGVWQNATAYSANELVVDEDAGTIWRCAVAHTSASSGTFLAARVASPTYWSNYTIGVRYKGAWASAATYAVGDFVVASNSFFAVANEAHTAASAFALDQTAGKWEVLIDTSAAMSTINAAVSSAQTSATQAALSVIAAGTYATAAGTYATAAGTYATAAALSAAMAAAGVVWCGTGSGANDIVLTAASFTLVDGATVAWRQVSDNTTTVRLNPNGVGLTALLDAAGTAVSTAGYLKSGRMYSARYSSASSKFEFEGPLVPDALVLNTTVQTGAFNAVSGYAYLVDTTSATINATLDTAAAKGSLVAFIPATAQFSTNRLRLLRNGASNKVYNNSDDFDIDVNIATTWVQTAASNTNWMLA